MNIFGPLPKGTRQVKFVDIVIDYFTKWIEAEPLAKITVKKIKSFTWRNVVCRFGVPRCFISDIGRQYKSKVFKDFCSTLEIKQIFTSVEYPQGNGQAEVANRIMLHGLKTRLVKKKGGWSEELLGILWAYRTNPREPTCETPFSLAYGNEAVVPIDIGLPIPRVENYNEAVNAVRQRAELDLLEERREATTSRLVVYQRMVA